jgi:GTP-binding protein
MSSIALEAEFVKSSTKPSECPSPKLPEYAMVGRSNVGKSSLINLLTGRKDLAKTSGKPGKTQLINHFKIRIAGSEDKPWYLVDLPGYGYAKVSRQKRDEFQKLIFPYLRKRVNLMCLFVLIDVRLKPQQNDMEFMAFLGTEGIPFAMVFTKSDKLKSEALQRNINAYNAEMLKSWESLPPQFITSSLKREGKEELIEFILETNKSFEG